MATNTDSTQTQTQAPATPTSAPKATASTATKVVETRQRHAAAIADKPVNVTIACSVALQRALVDYANDEARKTEPLWLKNYESEKSKDVLGTDGIHAPGHTWSGILRCVTASMLNVNVSDVIVVKNLGLAFSQYLTDYADSLTARAMSGENVKDEYTAYMTNKAQYKALIESGMVSAGAADPLVRAFLDAQDKINSANPVAGMADKVDADIAEGNAQAE